MRATKVAAGNGFARWLEQQLEIKGWSRSELARRAGVTSAGIDRIINLGADPGLKLLRGIAVALRLPLEDVMRHAGVLPPPTGRDRLAVLSQRLTRLGETQQGRVLSVIEQVLTIAEASADSQLRENVPSSQRRKPLPASATSIGTKADFLSMVEGKLSLEEYLTLEAMLESHDDKGGTANPGGDFRMVE